MVQVLAFSSVSPAGPGASEAATGLVTCPNCHTTDATMTTDAVKAGASWRCTRCTQRWDSDRLAVVAAYAVWESQHVTTAGGFQAKPGGAQ